MFPLLWMIVFAKKREELFTCVVGMLVLMAFFVVYYCADNLFDFG